MKHLLGSSELNRAEVDRIMAKAQQYVEYQAANNEKLRELQGKRVLNLFYEASTRTRSSFRLAAQALSAEVIDFAASGSSVEKGESLRDTVQTLSAYDPDAIVIRTPHVGVPESLTQWTQASVINAGDGKHEHPTQALLDLFALKQRIGSVEGKHVWIVGDVAHSRVARSNIGLLNLMGATVTVCGPPTLIPRDIETLGCDVEYTLDRVEEADVIYVLRIQRERMDEAFLPSESEFRRLFQINSSRLAPHQLLMHAGPVNRGLEVDADVIDCPQSMIIDQVRAGLVVRMAVLSEVLR